MTSYVEKYLSKGGKLTPVKSTLFEFEVEKDPERLPFRGVCFEGEGGRALESKPHMEEWSLISQEKRCGGGFGL